MTNRLLYKIAILMFFSLGGVCAGDKVEKVSISSVAPFSHEDIKKHVKDVLQAKISLSGDFDVIMSNSKLQLPRYHEDDQLVFTDVVVDDRKQSFRLRPEILSSAASLSIEPRQKGPLPMIDGKIQPLTDIPVLTRAITPGEEIVSSDITWQKMPSSRLSQTYLIRQEDVLGKTPVSQVLQPGQPLSRSDLKSPQIIKKGDLVTVTYRSEGLFLTSQVQALQDGAKGDTIRFMPLNNKKEVHAKVVGPSQAEIRPFMSE